MLGKIVLLSILLSIAAIDAVDISQQQTSSLQINLFWYILYFVAAQMESCCPQVVSALKDGSLIDPDSGYKVEVELIVSYGNCTANSTSFELVISEYCLHVHAQVCHMYTLAHST